MKLAIRLADKIVGVFIILALGILIFVIFMLGSSQRWFSRDYSFKTYFNSAAGLSPNMAVQYKGFTIGHVKSIGLDNDDRVEVYFTIFDTYRDRVRQGSLVEVQVSPIGMGNQFLFYPGREGNELLAEGETIPWVESREGKELLVKRLVELPEQGDSISNLVNRVGTLLGTANDVLVQVQEAFAGTEVTRLGQIIGNMAIMTEKLPKDIEDTLSRLMAQVEELSYTIFDPDGSVMAILDSEGKVYTDLVLSLDSISGILRNLEKTSDFVPAQLPQIAAILSDLHVALRSAEDVLAALINNPLLRRGVPERKETGTGGVYTRDLEF